MGFAASPFVFELFNVTNLMQPILIFRESEIVKREAWNTSLVCESCELQHMCQSSQCQLGRPLLQIHGYLQVFEQPVWLGLASYIMGVLVSLVSVFGVLYSVDSWEANGQNEGQL